MALEKFGMCTGVRYAEFFQGFIREGWALFSLSQKLNMHGVKKGKYLCVISDVTFPIIVNMKENISMKIDNFGHFFDFGTFGTFGTLVVFKGYEHFRLEYYKCLIR